MEQLAIFRNQRIAKKIRMPTVCFLSGSHLCALALGHFSFH